MPEAQEGPETRFSLTGRCLQGQISSRPSLLHHMKLKPCLLRSIQFAALTCALAFLSSCKTAPPPGAFSPRLGDEIVVAGQFVHTGTPVVLWMDPGGYDAYRVERRFSPIDKADWEHSTEEVRDLRTPNRYKIGRAH